MSRNRAAPATAGAVLAVLMALLPASSVPAQGQAAPEVAKGKLLVASERLHDSNFEKSIVLLLNHDDSGTLGLVLNRPSSVPVEKLLPDFEGGESPQQFFVGGPVELHKMSMLFSTSRKHTGHLHVLGDVYAGWDDELLGAMVTEPREGERFRLYAGHAGWAPGQLAAEISARAWYVLPATEVDIFGESSEERWREFIRRAQSRIASLEGPGAREIR